MPASPSARNEVSEVRVLARDRHCIGHRVNSCPVACSLHHEEATWTTSYYGQGGRCKESALNVPSTNGRYYSRLMISVYENAAWSEWASCGTEHGALDPRSSLGAHPTRRDSERASDTVRPPISDGLH